MANVKQYKLIAVSMVDKDNSDIDLLDSIDVNFHSFNVIYEPSMIPRCTLKISSKSAFPTSFYDVKNIALTIILGQQTYKYDIGVDKKIAKEANILTIQGFLCDYNAFHVISSAYLGDNLEDAILALNIRNKIEGIDQISQDFYQIQENNVQALIRLLNQSAQNSIFTLSDESIIIKNLQKVDTAKKQVMWSDIEFFSRNQKIKDLLDSKTSILDYEDTKSGLKLYSSFGKSFINTIDNDTTLINQSTSLPYRQFSADTVIKFKYNRPPIFPYEIGDTMSIDNTNLYKGKEMFVLSKTVLFDVDNVYSDALMIGQSLSNT